MCVEGQNTLHQLPWCFSLLSIAAQCCLGPRPSSWGCSTTISLPVTMLFGDLAPHLVQGPKLKSALKTRTIPPIEAFATPRGDSGEQQASLLAHMARMLLLQMCCSKPMQQALPQHACVDTDSAHTLPSHMQLNCSACMQAGVLNLHQPSAPTSPAGPQSPLQQGLLQVGQRNDNSSTVAGQCSEPLQATCVPNCLQCAAWLLRMLSLSAANACRERFPLPLQPCCQAVWVQ